MYTHKDWGALLWNRDLLYYSCSARPITSSPWTIVPNHFFLIAYLRGSYAKTHCHAVCGHPGHPLSWWVAFIPTPALLSLSARPSSSSSSASSSPSWLHPVTPIGSISSKGRASRAGVSNPIRGDSIWRQKCFNTIMKSILQDGADSTWTSPIMIGQCRPVKLLCFIMSLR